MNKDFVSLESIKIYAKICELLKKGDKKQISQKLGMHPVNLSRQLKNLKNGKGINTNILEAIEQHTGFKFINL